jgi:DNA repair exonuclease SbcCD ATPase subunit
MDSGFVRASEYSPSPSPPLDPNMIQWQEAIVERLDALQESSTGPAIERRLKELERKVASIATLKPEERQALRETINDLLIETQSLQAGSDAQAKRIEDLKKANEALQREIYDLRELTKRNLKTHWARMDELADEFDTRLFGLENGNKSEKTEAAIAHLNTLAQVLLIKAKSGQRGVTYAEAAKILGTSKARICQLRILIASDSRFNISWHPNRKNMKIICLKNYNLK